MEIPTLLAVVADMAKRSEGKKTVERALERLGQIDVWINNVGPGISRRPSQLTDDDIDAVMTMNVKTALYGMQEVLPHFKARNEGHVINISSLLGRVPFATVRSAYCGAKHFLNALTATFREAVKPTHPRIQFSLVSEGKLSISLGDVEVIKLIQSTMAHSQNVASSNAVVGPALGRRLLVGWGTDLSLCLQ